MVSVTFKRLSMASDNYSDQKQSEVTPIVLTATDNTDSSSQCYSTGDNVSADIALVFLRKNCERNADTKSNELAQMEKN